MKGRGGEGAHGVPPSGPIQPLPLLAVSLWELTVTAVFLLSHSFRWWAPRTYGGSGISLGTHNAKLLISCHVVCKGNLQKTTKEPWRGHFQLLQNWSLGPTTTDKDAKRSQKAGARHLP